MLKCISVCIYCWIFCTFVDRLLIVVEQERKIIMKMNEEYERQQKFQAFFLLFHALPLQMRQKYCIKMFIGVIALKVWTCLRKYQFSRIDIDHTKSRLGMIRCVIARISNVEKFARSFLYVEKIIKKSYKETF